MFWGCSLCWLAFCPCGPWTPSGAEALRRRSLFVLQPCSSVFFFFFLPSLALLFCQRAAQHCPPAFGRPHGWHARAVTMADPSHFCLCWPLLFLLLSHSLPSPRVSSVFQESTRAWPTGHWPVILCQWPIWSFLQSCSPAWCVWFQGYCLFCCRAHLPSWSCFKNHGTRDDALLY